MTGVGILCDLTHSSRLKKSSLKYINSTTFLYLNCVCLLFLESLEYGETIYILKSLDQELCAPAQERVNYLPHYDTIVKGGMYEYYASEGHNPLRE